MAEFELALADLFGVEGGLTDHPQDHGQLTNAGVTQRAYDDWRTRKGLPLQSVSLITEEEKRTLYFEDYWQPCRAGEIDNQKVASKYFSFYVNMRPKPAVRILQLACGDCGHPTIADGIPGHNTILAANAADPWNLLECLKDRAREHYYKIVADDPSQMVFINGWLNRVAA